VFRGNLVRTGPRVRTATGDIVFEKESFNFGGWMFGLEGHSLLVERNVFVNHLPYAAGSAQRAIVYFRPSISSNYLDTSLITSCIIRDNIGMSPVPSSLWVANPPPVYRGPWTSANTAMTYGADEPGFKDKALLAYTRLAGPVAAAGNMATKRFLYPHGFEARDDAFGGLG
jgi:hypothetical protein